MSKLVLNGDTSGSVTLDAPAVSGTTTLTLPATTGTLVVTSGAQTIEFADGSASTPSITNSGNTNTGIFFSAADTIDFTEGGTAVGQFDSSANFKFNSGYGSVATAYGCRAWVNFNGTANTNLTGTYTRTSPSTTLTVTATAHGLIVGSSVNLDFTTGTGLDGIYTVVTVADANTFTVTTVASTTTSGNVTLLRNTIRGSGNVSSITDNGTGDYTVNFTTAMPDINYCVVTNGGGPNVSSGTNTAGTVLQINGTGASPFFQAQTTTSCRIVSVTNIADYSGARSDCGFANVSILR
jgi:hypothetical protein